MPTFEAIKHELNRVVSLPPETYHELVALTGKEMSKQQEYVSLSAMIKLLIDHYNSCKSKGSAI